MHDSYVQGLILQTFPSRLSVRYQAQGVAWLKRGCKLEFISIQVKYQPASH